MKREGSTVTGRLTFVAASMLLAAVTTGCSIPRTGAATATEAALCDAWSGALPSRSHRDTEQTRAEIGAAYDAFLAACEGRALPGPLDPPRKMGPSEGEYGMRVGKLAKIHLCEPAGNAGLYYIGRRGRLA